MKLYETASQKTKAQAMVEFAIVLPLLLLLLYGLLETGRLLFIYSTIVTASRQAVRYGSATGLGLSTTANRYKDCAGIRLAAQKVDFLNAFNDDDIQIFHDDGPDPANPSGGLNETPYCTDLTQPIDTSTWQPSNSSRLVVKIDGDYLPIIPKLIPFVIRSKDSVPPNPIIARSARTILVSVAIVVTVPPSTWQASTPTNTPTLTPAPTDTPTQTLTPTQIFTDTPTETLIPTVSPTVTLSPTVTNTPTITLTPTITPTPVLGCGSVAPGTITLSGSTMTMTITNPQPYTINVKDIFVVWNHDKGHQIGNDKSLILQSATLGTDPLATPFWTGNSLGPSDTLTSPTTLLTIPGGTVSTITFTFNQSYDKFDNSEEILISLSTPGCENFPIHQTH